MFTFLKRATRRKYRAFADRPSSTQTATVPERGPSLVTGHVRSIVEAKSKHLPAAWFITIHPRQQPQGPLLTTATGRRPAVQPPF